MKKKTKAIIAIILVVILLAGGLCGYLLMFHQGAPQVHDYTTGDCVPGEAVSETEESDEEGNRAVFSAGVEFFPEDDAEAINEAIKSYDITSAGLVMEISGGTALDNLGVGDIFCLEGDESTPLGETYIGKITSVTGDDGSKTYVLEDPAVDEVFDVLDIDMSEVLTTENISQIEAAEGVTVQEVDSLDSHFTPLAETSPGYTLTTLVSTSSAGNATSLSSFSDKSLLVELDMDLFKVLGLDGKKPANDFQEKYDFQEGGRVKVYTTKSGICYHRDNCACVGRSKFEMTLSEAVDEGFEACYLCNPPLLGDDNGLFNFEPTLTLSGKFGLEQIACDLVFDWDILSGEGMEELALSVTGSYLAEIELKSSLQWEFSGRTTSISMPFGFVKAQGLKEKLCPFLFVGYNFTTPVTATNNAGIRVQTGSMPLTLAVAFYVDGEGKVSLSGKAYFNYKEAFEYSNVVVRDGEWVGDSTYSTGPAKMTLGLETELSGDIDLHAGISVLVYVFNLNPVELAIAQVGAQAEGTLKVAYSTDTENVDDAISSSYYMRAYMKLLELNVKLKVKLDFWFWSATVLNEDLTLTAKDHTIVEWGSKNPTRYSSSEMSYTVVTARDRNSKYYKDTNGDLIQETDGYRTTLFSEDFFTICGIDESFIYLLRNNPDVSGTHDIYRVSLADGTNKKIAEEVTNCLMIDATYIYYVTNFDGNTILRLNRSTLKEETFYRAAHSIRYMQQQGSGFYVVTEENSMFSWIFGPEIYYTLLSASGSVEAEYGQNPEVANLALSSLSGYYKASKVVSSGYLRNTASNIYWLSPDKTSHVEVTGVSGWNADDAGIFTTIANDDTAALPYRIVLWQASDGQQVPVTDVQSDQAFFTLRQSSSGSWFFFDQTDDSLILYSMNRDFSNKTVVKTFSLSEIPYNLTSCGMVIMDDRIYFYSIPDNSTSAVLYRYDIV